MKTTAGNWADPHCTGSQIQMLSFLALNTYTYKEKKRKKEKQCQLYN